jgi:hypothetical protein
MLQARRSRLGVPIRSFNFFNLPNYSSLNMALELTYPLTEMTTRKTPGGVGGVKGRPECKADNLTAMCEPIVYAMWDPRHLTTL